FTIEFVGFVVFAGTVFLVPARRNLIPNPTGARAIALGGILLATACVLHGAEFIRSESDNILVGLYGLGAASFLAGVIGGGAPKTRVGVLGIAAVLLGASVLIAAASPDQTLEVDGSGGTFWLAHALRAAAYGAVLIWLWAGVRASVRTRFVAAYAALLVVVVLALSTTLTAVITANVEREELDRVATQLGGALASIDDQKDTLSSFVRLIADSDAVHAGVADRSRLEELAESFTQPGPFRLDMVVFTTPGGRFLAFSGEGPELTGAGPDARRLQRADVLTVLGSPVLLEDVIREGRELALSIDRIDDDTIAILAAAEVVDPTVAGRRAGIVAAANYLDRFTVEEISSDLRPADATLFVDGRAIASGIPDTDLSDIRLPDEALALAAGEDAVTLKQVVGSNSYFGAFSALEAVQGRPILSLSSPAEIIATTRSDVIRSLFLIALGVGVIALVLAWVSGRRITRPIQDLTTTARAVREGDLSARASVSGQDEVGQLGETFNQMTASLVATTREEQALRARIEAIIQSMADGLVAVDADRKVLAFNIEAELLTGTDGEEAMGRSIDEVLSVVDGNGERVELPIHSLTEGAVSGVYIARPHGSPVPVSVTSAVLRGADDAAAGGVAVIRDMTREHEVEKMKGEFLSNISHELRTPLTPIKGYAELLAGKETPPDRVRTFAEGIVDATRRLERIVALLVDFSALEAGKLAPASGAVDVASLVRTLADEWRVRARRHEVIADVEDDLPAVTGDEQLLRRTLEEILDNAVKFSPQGGTIRLEAKGISMNGVGPSSAVQVMVSDEGIGIPTEELPTIFTDFHQLDASETRTYGGLGLGLAFVQRIVAAHQGDVAVESEPQRGTRLTITIPAVAAARERKR
ncbi:MAG TPA: ATP-binding protein, partial [Actinomycetota bacterium]|nr:ATP-binding protein [Actinomycetota bacterium]